MYSFVHLGWPSGVCDQFVEHGQSSGTVRLASPTAITLAKRLTTSHCTAFRFNRCSTPSLPFAPFQQVIGSQASKRPTCPIGPTTTLNAGAPRFTVASPLSSGGVDPSVAPKKKWIRQYFTAAGNYSL